MTEDEVKDLSPDQFRIWRNGRKRAVERFVEVVGDKLVTNSPAMTPSIIANGGATA